LIDFVILAIKDKTPRIWCKYTETCYSTLRNKYYC